MCRFPKSSRVSHPSRRDMTCDPGGLTGMMAATCFLTPPPLLSPPGVDLSNIIKMVPKMSTDGPQEPTHDILQVRGGGPCEHAQGSLSPCLGPLGLDSAHGCPWC